MSKKFTFTNNAPAEESAVKCDYNLAGGNGIEEKANPGAQTGPYGDGLKENSISIPVPASNLQIEVGAGKSVVIETAKLKEIVFYEEYIKEVADNKDITAVEEDVPDPVGSDFTITYLTGAVDFSDLQNLSYFNDVPLKEATEVTPTSGSFGEEITSNFVYTNVGDVIEITNTAVEPAVTKDFKVAQQQYIVISGEVPLDITCADIVALINGGSERVLVKQADTKLNETYTAPITQTFTLNSGDYDKITVLCYYVGSENQQETPGE